MKKILLAIFLIMIALPGVIAQPDHSDSSDILPLLENQADCSRLSEEQLEGLGEYYMELHHPGEAHSRMDSMMGGEGSESLRQMHIRMGTAFYCGQGPEYMMSGSGMMSDMTGLSMVGAGMMYGYGYSGLFSVLIGVVIALLVVMITLLLRRKK